MASSVSKEQRSSGPCFQDVYYRVVGYSYRHQADVFCVDWGWGPEGFRLSRSRTWLPDSGQVESGISLIDFQGPNQSGQFLLWKPGKSLNCLFQRGEGRI